MKTSEKKIGTRVHHEMPGTVAFIADTYGKLVLFLAGASRYLQPGFRMLFTNPSFTILENSFDSVSVSKGDTVFVSYHNEQPLANEVVSVGSEFKDILGEEFYTFEGKEFERLYFFYHSNFTGNCRPSQQRAEIVELLSVIEPEQDSLQITMEVPEQDELWPSIPTGGARSEFNFNQVEDTIQEIIVEVTQNGEPVEEQSVIINAEWVLRSGGHNHEAPNDSLYPPLDRLGWIVNIEEADSLQGELPTITSRDGQIRLRYRAPEFGGEVRLVAKTVNANGDTLQAEDQLTVEVPDMEPLPDDGIYYEKVGGTWSHRGPRVDNAFLDYRNPDNNHYGTQAFVDSLVSLAEAWHDTVTTNNSRDNRQTPLNINDMSLPNGGKFDIEGEFLVRLRKAGHDYHRVGRDVDIRTTRDFTINRSGRSGVLIKPLLNSDGTAILDDEDNKIYRNRTFERLCVEMGANPDPRIHGADDNEHYHIYFY